MRYETNREFLRTFSLRKIDAVPSTLQLKILQFFWKEDFSLNCILRWNLLKQTPAKFVWNLGFVADVVLIIVVVTDVTAVLVAVNVVVVLNNIFERLIFFASVSRVLTSVQTLHSTSLSTRDTLNDNKEGLSRHIS